MAYMIPVARLIGVNGDAEPQCDDREHHRDREPDGHRHEREPQVLHEPGPDVVEVVGDPAPVG